MQTGELGFGSPRAGLINWGVGPPNSIHDPAPLNLENRSDIRLKMKSYKILSSDAGYPYQEGLIITPCELSTAHPMSKSQTASKGFGKIQICWCVSVTFSLSVSCHITQQAVVILSC